VKNSQLTPLPWPGFEPGHCKLKRATGDSTHTAVCEIARQHVPYPIAAAVRFLHSGGDLYLYLCLLTISDTCELCGLCRQLVGQYDIVVNCSGFGSRELINDTQLVPNRGHLVSVCFVEVI